MRKMTTNLEVELNQLFDIRTAKIKRDKKLEEEAMAAQKDVKLLILMFSDGIPSVTLPLGDNEILEWDAGAKNLLYRVPGQAQYIECVSKEILVRIRPHLLDLVTKAKSFYID